MVHPTANTTPALRRQLGTPGATLMGLGSMLGTGVFVSIGLGAGVAGPAVILAIVLAALVATCNALSSAQLAASHPVAGGTYEYGYRYLSPHLGFAAGWMFLCAKTASAAAAALGFAGYLAQSLSLDAAAWQKPLALAAVATLTAVVLAGLRRSAVTNAMIVSVTLTALIAFILAGFPELTRADRPGLTPFFAASDGPGGAAGLLHATALMFVAFTGYARIATMSEEVREPQRTIPRAIILTVVIVAALYVGVAAVAIVAVGAGPLHRAAQTGAAPLEAAARALGSPALAVLIAIGAMTAMLGVLLNLVLGLSRVLLAMARRRDVPAVLARVDEARSTPAPAVLVVGGLICAGVLVGDVRVTWSFSAFSVLVYYGITNAAALRLPAAARRYPRAIAWAGLLACVLLAFMVEPAVWLTGLGMIGAGMIWRYGFRHFAARKPQ